MPSRRRYLATLGSGAVAAVAGCSSAIGRPTASEPPDAATPPLDADRQVHGSDGRWSSFLQRREHQKRPRDPRGRSTGRRRERGLARRGAGAPAARAVVADGRCSSRRDAMRVFDAADGTELWRVAGVGDHPVVRGDTVYVADRLDRAVRALAVDGGGAVVGVGRRAAGRTDAVPRCAADRRRRETVHALDPASGDEQWTRRVFGRVLRVRRSARGSRSPSRPRRARCRCSTSGPAKGCGATGSVAADVPPVGRR
ncbi:PQQ-binding-like beta-propeller repeat protein [Halobaculum litoreum]|uniref:PQQ-binding-like beta-propeller repeat protein n=1 Tax=Halobaculum litoreum TaxID=3031998 RepID=A0ABD5XSS2_9EURY